MIVDYHMHLRDPRGDIDHSVEAIERFVETAAARGVDEIGFTEHVYYFRQTAELWTVPYQVERCHFDLDVYCGAVLEAKQRALPVKLGLEVDHVGARQPRLTEILTAYPWDLLLGSVHWIDGHAVDAEPGLWEHAGVEEIWRRYFAALAELAGSGAVDVLAHPDLPKIFRRRPHPAVVGELYEDAAEAVSAAGVAIEISTAGLRKPVGELYPDAALLAACARRGVPITLASDAHDPRLVGEQFTQALAAARAAGYRHVAVFDGGRRRVELLG